MRCSRGIAPDRELAKLYAGLWASENGHYRVFLERARDLHAADDVEKRWGWMLDQEAKLVREQTPGPRMHSGWA